MAALLSAVGDVFTAAIGWVGTVGAEIAGFTEGKADNPMLLLFCVAVPLCGLGVGMFARLLRTRG